jgi:hypothetical protein
MDPNETALPGTRPAPPQDDPRFDRLAASCQLSFAEALRSHGPALFRIDAGDLFALYIDHLPADQRQYHRCDCCRRFIGRYGSRATIGPDGALRSALWRADAAPELYRASLEAMAAAVAKGRVTSVFFSEDEVWGTAKGGGFTHVCLTPPKDLAARRGVSTAGRRMAQKRQDFSTLQHGLADYRREVVAEALTLLETDALYRTEKVIGPARFLLDLHDRIVGQPKPVRERLVWRAVAEAPVGFCTPRSSMIGTLLDDIAAGLPFKDIKARFAAKMHPLHYQRPQAAPAAGNIAAAERRIAELGLEPALHRRYARLDEIDTVWRPVAPAEAPRPTGLFAHLLPKGRAGPAPLDVPAQAITWVKFARTVLPGALRMAILLKPNMNFGALLTAVHAEAPPLLQWDRVERRNPFSCYVYHAGSAPEAWGLRQGDWAEVSAVALLPHLWGGEDRHANHGKATIFTLAGARDSRADGTHGSPPGLCLFPEILRTDLHEIRATIEAYSRSRHPAGFEDSSACGILVGYKDERNTQIRVTGRNGTACYTVDRWD